MSSRFDTSSIPEPRTLVHFLKSVEMYKHEPCDTECGGTTLCTGRHNVSTLNDKFTDPTHPGRSLGTGHVSPYEGHNSSVLVIST